jgi:hypothetical protein
MGTYTFTFEGRTFDLLDDDQDWMITETRDVDRWIGGGGLLGSGVFTQLACQAAVSIARVRDDLTIRGWLDSQTNRVIGDIFEQVQAQIQAENTARQAEEAKLVLEGVVLSPSSGGPAQQQPKASRSSTSSKRAGGSPRSSATASTPATGPA